MSLRIDDSVWRAKGIEAPPSKMLCRDPSMPEKANKIAACYISLPSANTVFVDFRKIFLRKTEPNSFTP